MKKIAVIGSTGSIGRQTLDVAAAFADKLQIVALAAAQNVELLEEQVHRFRPAIVAVMNEEAAHRLRARVSFPGVRVVSGMGGIIECATLPQAQEVVMAVSGMVGLLPTIAAVQAGKNIALANKETLVAGGELVTAAARRAGTKLLPVDSEHSAIWQCLGEHHQAVEKLILTASGGPFWQWDRLRLIGVTPEMALRHPKWVMGPKITVDSATLINKGLEVIEARWLFDVDYDHIEVVIHPQSIIHSMVAFHDGAVLAQMGLPDMRVPIQHALSWPERWPNGMSRLELPSLRELTFSTPDAQRFPGLDLAYRAGRAGGTMPAVFNAADEAAVALFLQGRIGFTDIPRLVESAMEKHDVINCPDLDCILQVDAATRRQVEQRGVELKAGT